MTPAGASASGASSVISAPPAPALTKPTARALACALAYMTVSEFGARVGEIVGDLIGGPQFGEYGSMFGVIAAPTIWYFVGKRRS